MPRNTRKLNELEAIINAQKLEIAKYKQLISNINGLIKINNPEHVDLLAGNIYSDIDKDRKAETYKLSTDELAEALTSRLNKDGLRLFITREKDPAQEFINKHVKEQKKANEKARQEQEAKEKETKKIEPD
jgi:hypothetical protein